MSSGASLAFADDNKTFDEKLSAQEAKIDESNKNQKDSQTSIEKLEKEVKELKDSQAKAKEKNDKILEESKKFAQEVDKLSKEISVRDESLKNQARQMQTEGVNTSFISVLFNSKSLSDGVTKITAMNTLLDANKKMIENQKDAKTELTDKIKKNQKDANDGYALLTKMSDQNKDIDKKLAELEVAKLTAAADKATAVDEKAKILAEKAVAESKLMGIDDPAVSHSNAPGDIIIPIPTDSGSNTYPVGQCTWGAKVLAPWAHNWWGNGAQWATSAARAGFKTGDIPKVGAIASWDDGGYGHVAVVAAVNSVTSIQVNECNYAGNQSIKNYRGWFNPTTTSSGKVTYIYPNN